MEAVSCKLNHMVTLTVAAVPAVVFFFFAGANQPVPWHLVGSNWAAESLFLY